MTFDKRGTGGSDRVSRASRPRRAHGRSARGDGCSRDGASRACSAFPKARRCPSCLPPPIRTVAARWCCTAAFRAFPTGLRPRRRSQAFFGYVEKAWGTGGSVQRFAPSRADDAAFQRWWGRNERLGASPAAVTALMRMNSQIEICGVLPAVRVPTLVIHRTDDKVVSVEGGRDVAAQIPGARLAEFPGKDHLFYVGEGADEISDAIEEFLTGSRGAVDSRPRPRHGAVHRYRRLDREGRRTRRSTLASSARRSSRHDPPQSHALSRPRGEDDRRRVSGDIRRSGARRALRLRHCRGDQIARHRQSAPGFTPANAR